MLIPDYQDTRSSKPWAVDTGAIFTERQKPNIIINLDDVDKIVVIKDGVRRTLEEHIKFVIADALRDAYSAGFHEGRGDDDT